jgi:undecaprenyl pyrophosphate phosphatase UppP
MKSVTMLEQLEDRLNEVPEDLRQAPVMFAAAALIGPFIIVLLALFAPSLSSPLLTVAAVVFVVAVTGFALTTYRRYRVQQAEDLRQERARTRRRGDRRLSASRVSRADAEGERRAS